MKMVQNYSVNGECLMVKIANFQIPQPLLFSDKKFDKVVEGTTSGLRGNTSQCTKVREREGDRKRERERETESGRERESEWERDILVLFQRLFPLIFIYLSPFVYVYLLNLRFLQIKNTISPDLPSIFPQYKCCG